MIGPRCWPGWRCRAPQALGVGHDAGLGVAVQRHGAAGAEHLLAAGADHGASPIASDLKPVGIRDARRARLLATRSRPRPGRAAPWAASRRSPRAFSVSWLRQQTSSVSNMTASRRAAGRGSRAVGWARLWTSTAAAMAFRRDIARVFLGWAKAAHRQARARASPWQENTLLRNGPELGDALDCQVIRVSRPNRPDVHGPPSSAGFGISRVLGSAAPCGTPRIGRGGRSACITESRRGKRGPGKHRLILGKLRRYFPSR